MQIVDVSKIRTALRFVDSMCITSVLSTAQTDRKSVNINGAGTAISRRCCGRLPRTTPPPPPAHALRCIRSFLKGEATVGHSVYVLFGDVSALRPCEHGSLRAECMSGIHYCARTCLPCMFPLDKVCVCYLAGCMSAIGERTSLVRPSVCHPLGQPRQ